MGAGQHGLSCMLPGQIGQRVDEGVDGGQQDIVPGAAKHQGIGEVVNVLGGAGKVDELTDRGEFLVFGHLLLDVIFHRLDVVIGHRFDGFDAPGGGFVESRGNGGQPAGGAVAE